LIDGYREELLGFDSSLQFDFFDTFNKAVKRFFSFYTAQMELSLALE